MIVMVSTLFKKKKAMNVTLLFITVAAIAGLLAFFGIFGNPCINRNCAPRRAELPGDSNEMNLLPRSREARNETDSTRALA